MGVQEEEAVVVNEFVKEHKSGHNPDEHESVRRQEARRQSRIAQLRK